MSCTQSGSQPGGTAGRSVPVITPAKISCKLRLGYGCSPSVQISHSTTPKEKTSTCSSKCRHGVGTHTTQQQGIFAPKVPLHTHARHAWLSLHHAVLPAGACPCCWLPCQLMRHLPAAAQHKTQHAPPHLLSDPVLCLLAVDARHGPRHRREQLRRHPAQPHVLYTHSMHTPRRQGSLSKWHRLPSSLCGTPAPQQHTPLPQLRHSHTAQSCMPAAALLLKSSQAADTSSRGLVPYRAPPSFALTMAVCRACSR